MDSIAVPLAALSGAMIAVMLVMVKAPIVRRQAVGGGAPRHKHNCRTRSKDSFASCAKSHTARFR